MRTLALVLVALGFFGGTSCNEEVADTAITVPSAGTNGVWGTSSGGGGASGCTAGVGGGGWPILPLGQLDGGPAGGIAGTVFWCPYPAESDGVVYCGNGTSYREASVACTDEPPSTLPITDGTVDCEANPDECDRFRNGYCYHAVLGETLAPGVCRSGCNSDDDCPPDTFCDCNAGIATSYGSCVATHCRTSEECGVGLFCASFGTGFACQTKFDECFDGPCGGPAFCELSPLIVATEHGEETIERRVCACN
jgi:hypothetical protein